jgi:hypothetical protein
MGQNPDPCTDLNLIGGEASEGHGVFQFWENKYGHSMYLFSSPEVEITTSLHFHHFPEPVKLGRGLWKRGDGGKGRD